MRTPGVENANVGRLCQPGHTDRPGRAYCPGDQTLERFKWSTLKTMKVVHSAAIGETQPTAMKFAKRVVIDALTMSFVRRGRAMLTNVRVWHGRRKNEP